ncbi:hypothetical protein BEWA_010140 [Theileria equi strain WA]|uniref:SAC3/GANP/THP3 conserved domain-containing protein n=1 Tax=Theileria equi strain WA TaxID=1537102 RepID=L0B195_THEEQ|nr:hypothetical protein BEWA_010140 [Theileria equi strain WA]AFZ81600.1 hypothetical protein BEWA_010140 [Theileria equi strain WA]|eukprot:XP_004831266.1 hypothetical protein BEWA_010140 [Theileria equi strain WA]
MNKDEPPDVLLQRSRSLPFGTGSPIGNPLLRPLDENNITMVLLNFQDLISYLSNDNTKGFVGKLYGMCSIKEYNQKIQMNTANDLERNSLREVDPKLTLKSFQRSDASRIFKPEDVRPVLWCRRTLYYILAYFVDADINKKDYIMDKRFSYLDIYNFLRDRLRSIWQDLTVQHCTRNRGYIECFEISIRFLIYSNEILCENEEYDASQNFLLLNTCLDKLMNGYSDVHSTVNNKNLTDELKSLDFYDKPDVMEIMDVLTYTSPHEAEFWSYRLLLLIPQLLTPECSAVFCDICQRIPKCIKNSDIIRFSIKVCLSVTSGNVYSYFNLMKDSKCHPLQSALMNRFSGSVRVKFLHDIILHKIVKETTNPVHFNTLKTIFGFEDDAKLLSLLQRYNITVDGNSKKLCLEGMDMKQLEYDNNYLNKVSGKIQTTSSIVFNKITSKYPSRQILFDPDFNLDEFPKKPILGNTFQKTHETNLHDNSNSLYKSSVPTSTNNAIFLGINSKVNDTDSVVTNSGNILTSFTTDNRKTSFDLDKTSYTDQSTNINIIHGTKIQISPPKDILEDISFQKKNVVEIKKIEFLNNKSEDSLGKRINRSLESNPILNPARKLAPKRPIILSRPKIGTYTPARNVINKFDINSLNKLASSILKSVLLDPTVSIDIEKATDILGITNSTSLNKYTKAYKYSGPSYKYISKREIYLSKGGSQLYLKKLLFLMRKLRKMTLPLQLSHYNSKLYTIYEKAKKTNVNNNQSFNNDYERDENKLLGKHKCTQFINKWAKRQNFVGKIATLKNLTCKIISMCRRFIGPIRHIKHISDVDMASGPCEANKPSELPISLYKSLYNVIFENSKFVIGLSKEYMLNYSKNLDIGDINLWGSGIFLHLKLFDMDDFQELRYISNRSLLNEVVKFKRAQIYIDPEYRLSLKSDILNICGINIKKKTLFTSEIENQSKVFELFKNTIPYTEDKRSFNIPFGIFASMNTEYAVTQNNEETHKKKLVDFSNDRLLNESLINIFLVPRPIFIEGSMFADILTSKNEIKMVNKTALLSVMDSLIVLSYLFGLNGSYAISEKSSGLYILCYRIHVSIEDMLILSKLLLPESDYKDQSIILNESLDNYQKILERYIHIIEERIIDTLTEHSEGYNIKNAPDIIKKKLVLSCVGFQAKNEMYPISSHKESADVEQRTKNGLFPIMRIVYPFGLEVSLKKILRVAIEDTKIRVLQKRVEFNNIYKLLMDLSYPESSNETLQNISEILVKRIQDVINYILFNFPNHLWNSYEDNEVCMDNYEMMESATYSKNTLIATFVKLQHSIDSIGLNGIKPDDNIVISRTLRKDAAECCRFSFVRDLVEQLEIRKIIVPYVVDIFLSNVKAFYIN